MPAGRTGSAACRSIAIARTRSSPACSLTSRLRAQHPARPSCPGAAAGRAALPLGALRYRWVPGIATVRPGEDPLARQRKIIAWHPLRALNAINVRVLRSDLLAVHVQLSPAQAGDNSRPAPTAGGTGRSSAPALTPGQK
jgi:hypothetical protein